MGKDIVLGEDWLITLSVIYGLGAVLSVWATLLSPMLLDIWDTPQGQKKKTDRDWSTIFLVLLLLQPVTFAGSAVGMWWIWAFAVVPPAHFVLTFFSFLAIDFFRPDDDVFSKYKYSVLMWKIFVLTSFLHVCIIVSAIITTYLAVTKRKTFLYCKNDEVCCVHYCMSFIVVSIVIFIKNCAKNTLFSSGVCL